MKEKEPTMMATVYLRSQSGLSLLNEKSAAPLHPERYAPSPETVEQALHALQELGFRIEARGMTLSISGPVALFEEKCHVRISRMETTRNEPGKGDERTNSLKSDEPVMNIPDLDDVIEGIVIATPGIPF
jgi:hypothetical protein